MVICVPAHLQQIFVLIVITVETKKLKSSNGRQIRISSIDGSQEFCANRSVFIIFENSFPRVTVRIKVHRRLLYKIKVTFCLKLGL